jgi:hypothetical protein
MGRAYQNRKESMAKTSANKSKVYGKYGREIYVVAKSGGFDPGGNLALRSIIEIETDSGLVGINESYGDLPMLDALAKVVDPHSQKDFVSSKALRNLEIVGADVSFEVELGYPAKSLIPALRQEHHREHRPHRHRNRPARQQQPRRPSRPAWRSGAPTP